MASYTIEDVELLRQKSGISYQEAVSLLDYHNGNVARALVDLERNGRMKPETADTTSSKNNGKGKSGTASAQHGQAGHSGSNAVVSLINKLYRSRVKISRASTPIINLSLLFTIVGALISPHLLILSVVLVLVLGYHISFVKDDPDFAGENMDRMVKNAASNVRSTVNEFARSFQDGMNGDKDATTAADKTAEQSTNSFYQDKPAAEYHTCPTINVPVQVDSQDGSVTIEDDTDGFHSATIK